MKQDNLFECKSATCKEAQVIFIRVFPSEMHLANLERACLLLCSSSSLLLMTSLFGDVFDLCFWLVFLPAFFMIFRSFGGFFLVLFESFFTLLAGASKKSHQNRLFC